VSYSLFLSVCTTTNLTLGTTFGGQANPLLTRLYDYEKELIDKKDVQCHDMGFLDEYEEEN